MNPGISFRGVRYQVTDVARAVAFYTQTLGFTSDMQKLPAFAQVSAGELRLILSGPGASGSRPLPDGRQQQPGGRQVQIEDPDGNPLELFEPADR
jgi:glyoxylase I family protein